MEKNKKQTAGKVLLFTVVLIILVIAWVGSYRLKYHKWPWVDFQEAINRVYKQKTTDVAPGNQQQVKDQKVEKSEEEIKSDLFRQGTMNDLSGKIGKLSPVKPVLGGKWFVDRFWFADDRNAYVEYEDGHNLRRILVNVQGQEEKPDYMLTAYFEPGENDWVLKTGQDTMAGKKLDLYEFNPDKKLWVKKN